MLGRITTDIISRNLFVIIVEINSIAYQAIEVINIHSVTRSVHPIGEVKIGTEKIIPFMRVAA